MGKIKYRIKRGRHLGLRIITQIMNNVREQYVRTTDTLLSCSDPILGYSGANIAKVLYRKKYICA